MITCKEDLYGTEFIVESKEDSILLEAKCIELGIEKATWSGCDYKNGVMFGLISKDLNTPHSKKLLFTRRAEGEDTMDEFLKLKRLTLEDLKPQTKEAEWVNGDDVEYFHPVSEWTTGGRYVCLDSGTDCHIFADKVGNLDYAESFQIRKPETPEQKLERERIEAAKRLYTKHCTAVRHPVKDLDNNSELLNAWLVIVDETNYKVKGE